LAELNIEIICANSSQAKGTWSNSTVLSRTRLASRNCDLPGVCDMESGNEFLAGFP
jgi:hypothetical protein